MTQQEQIKLSPSDVLKILKVGNANFAKNNLTVRNHTQRMLESIIGQYPYAVVLSCIDSRVPVEDIFQANIGDLFVARVAGNVIDEDILGSLEFSCTLAGAKLLLVLGHHYCGAIKSAIENVKLGNLTALLSKIKPAVQQTSLLFNGDTTSANPKYVEAVCELNVKLSIENIRSKSPILKEMEDREEIKIVGAIYDIKTGAVQFLE